MARTGATLYSLDAPLRLSSEQVDCWDQVAKFGSFAKADAEGVLHPAVFNLSHLGQFLDNFERQKNPLWADFNHDFGECLARYDALALVVDGVVLRLSAHGPVASPPREKLVNPESGAVEDGVYAHRFELTEAGAGKLPNTFYVSPFFWTAGKDESGSDVGYVLVNIAWVNGPFLDGMAPLKMHIFRNPTGASGAFSNGDATMADEVFKKRYGIDDNASAEQMKAAMKKYGEEVDAQMKKFAASDENYKKFASCFGDEESFKKFAADEAKMASFKKFVEAPGSYSDEIDPEKKKEEKEAMAKFAKDLGLSAGTSIPALYAAFSAKHTPHAEVVALKQRVEAVEKERAAEKKATEDQKFSSLADRAIKFGYSKEKRADMIEFARSNYSAAESFVSELPGAKALGVLDRTKLLVNGEKDAGPIDLGGGKVTAEGYTETGAGVDAKAQAYMKDNPKVSYEQAMVAVVRADPSLFRRA